MQFDLEEFPFVWLRDHDDDDGHNHDEAADREALLGLLKRGERFVVIVERMPGLDDMANAGQDDRRQRARMFKIHRAEISRLCSGMIMIGRAASLPLPFQKAIHGLTSAIGIAVLFAASEQQARELGRSLVEG